MTGLFRPKECFRPETVNEAVRLLAKYDNAWVIAGGTDVLIDKSPEIEYLVDATRLPLSYIKGGEGLRIGALTTMRELEKSPLLQNGPYRVLGEAAHKFGSLAIRNVATVGGNICNALCCADTPPALVALDATVKIVSDQGERTLPLEKIFERNRQTCLLDKELVTEIQVPAMPPRTGTSFMKFARTSVDLALVNSAVRVTLDGDVMKDVRVVVGGGIGLKLIRSTKAEETLENQKVSESLFEKAAEIVSGELKPRATSIRGSAYYKREICKVLVKDSLMKAVERAREG